MPDFAHRLEDEHAIIQLLYAYSAGIDSGQFDDTARLFEHGTWFLNPDTPCSGTEAVAEFLHSSVILYGSVPGTRHTNSNARIDIADDRSTATCRSYVVVFQTVPGHAPHIMFQGAYDDTFARTDGQWQFYERRIETDGTGDMALHLKSVQAVGS